MFSRITNNALSTIKSYKYISLYRSSSRQCSDSVTNEPNAEEILIKQLKEENERLTDVIRETEDKYKRSLAESENVRQRMMRQVDEAKQFGIHKFCKELLEVADTLSAATESVDEAGMLGNENMKDMFNGLKMTETQLLRVFGRHGVERIEPRIGEKFDPNVHEAMFQIPISRDGGQMCGTVGTLTKVGYRLHNKTLRPATVGVFQ